MTSKIERTSLGLRNALFDEIDALRRGEADFQRARSIAALASHIIAVARLEMEVAAEAPDGKKAAPRALVTLGSQSE